MSKKINILPAKVLHFEQTERPGFSRLRLLAFYLGKNRNKTFITKEVGAELQDVVGVPIIGEFSWSNEEFGSHGGDYRAYGFVPTDCNFEWEQQEVNGILRTCATFDVIIWTGMFKEANCIEWSNQSMELSFTETTGEFRKLTEKECLEFEMANDDENYFVFSHAKIQALCILGKDHDPCFENSKFYPLNYLEEIKKIISEYEHRSGEMHKIIIELNDEQKAIFDSFVAAGGDFVMALHKWNDSLSAHAELELQFEAIKKELADVKEQYETLQTSNEDTKTTFEAEKEVLNTSINDLTIERDSLKERLETFEAAEAVRLDGEKTQLIETFKDVVEEDVIASFNDSRANYSVEQLEKELSVYAVRALRKNASMEFSHVGATGDDDPFIQALSKHVK